MVTIQNLRKPIVFTTTFTTYTATAIMGQGGSGRVFKATNEDGEEFAIKLLHQAQTTTDKVKRFKNELNFCQRNQHPNILTVVDHGINKDGEMGSPFYVMSLYTDSLRDLLVKGIPPDKVLKYYSQILDGVEAAHLKAVIHRDLKPENILYLADGDCLIIADFGIAHFEEDALITAVDTQDTSRLANFQYAAPEQRSRGLSQTKQTDIYALGLILNEMFTHEIPLGTGYKTITKTASEYEYLDDLVEQMIRQSPEERPDSIDNIKMQLIGRREEFITRQKVDELKGTVVPVSELDDPIINDPIRITDVDWKPNTLTIRFQQPVNKEWIWAFHHMGNYSSVWGKGPEAFKFSGDRVVIGATEGDVQLILKNFKDWLPKANAVYKRRMEELKQEEEARIKQELERQIQEEEARQRVLKQIRLT